MHNRATRRVNSRFYSTSSRASSLSGGGKGGLQGIVEVREVEGRAKGKGQRAKEATRRGRYSQIPAGFAECAQTFRGAELSRSSPALLRALLPTPTFTASSPPPSSSLNPSTRPRTLRIEPTESLSRIDTSCRRWRL